MIKNTWMCEGYQYLAGDADLEHEGEFVDFLNKSARFLWCKLEDFECFSAIEAESMWVINLLRKHNLEADVKITGNTSKDISPS